MRGGVIVGKWVARKKGRQEVGGTWAGNACSVGPISWWQQHSQFVEAVCVWLAGGEGGVRGGGKGRRV